MDFIFKKKAYISFITEMRFVRYQGIKRNQYKDFFEKCDGSLDQVTQFLFLE